MTLAINVNLEYLSYLAVDKLSMDGAGVESARDKIIEITSDFVICFTGEVVTPEYSYKDALEQYSQGPNKGFDLTNNFFYEWLKMNKADMGYILSGIEGGGIKQSIFDPRKGSFSILDRSLSFLGEEGPIEDIIGKYCNNGVKLLQDVAQKGSIQFVKGLMDDIRENSMAYPDFCIGDDFQLVEISIASGITFIPISEKIST